VHPPYRIVYRLVGIDEVHVLTVHHSFTGLPSSTLIAAQQPLAAVGARSDTDARRG